MELEKSGEPRAETPPLGLANIWEPGKGRGCSEGDGKSSAYGRRKTRRVWGLEQCLSQSRSDRVCPQTGARSRGDVL